MGMPETIWAYEVNVDKDYGAYCTRNNSDRSTQYTLTSSVASKLEAAEKLAVALKSVAGQFRIYEESHRTKSREGASNEERSDRINKANVNAYCAERAEEVLAHWQRVNGGKS